MAETELSRTVLYNETTGGTTTVPDTRDGHLSGETLIGSGAGWRWAPVEPEARQGEQPELVKFVPVAVEPETDYEAKTVPELQDMLRGRELATTGNKGELIDRLTEDDESPEG